jgi:2-polyprenyl-3-methyl-5-hydroxy-6-metoxy-1,4-benzoquinol methylase
MNLPEAEGPERRLLDIGSNWGRWSISAAKKGYRPVGIDSSLDAIQAARRVAQQQGITAIFLVADARYLPFSRNSFDVTFSHSTLQHLSKEDVKLVVAECARVLKASGTCLIQMANTFGLRSLWNQAKRGFRKPTHFEGRYWRPWDLRNTFGDLIGPTHLFVDGYFGFNVHSSDKDLLLKRYRMVVTCSDILRRMSKTMPWMKYWADSLYVQSVREVEIE